MGGRTVPCAIYTRKSSEEGLDQEFNSLDAQRAACSAYIQSQAGEGWIELPQPYDDGGISGGTMERAGLQQLLDDIRASRVKVVVVYKVDRLTRSLSDFAKIIDVLEEHGASFVSVTQQFSTTTSMGRLTLNMLLSFAQFEREVTAERIRDKIAASKKQGIWMGGVVPLGYEAIDRKLVINEQEASTVRTIFELYREHGSSRIVKEEGDRLDLRTKARERDADSNIQGKHFTRGHIHKILNNRLYIGEITHKGTSYPGNHDPIIDRELWDAVQDQLRRNAIRRKRADNIRSPSLLTGVLKTADGDRLTPSHANRGNQRYRYYVSQPSESSGGKPWRLPATSLERVIIDVVSKFLMDQGQISARADNSISADRLQALFERAEKLADNLQRRTPNAQRAMLQGLLNQVTVHEERLALRVSGRELGRYLEIGDEPKIADFDINVPVVFRKRGFETKLVIGNDQSTCAPDPKLVELIVQAHRWFEELKNGKVISISAIAKRDGLHSADVSRVLPLAFLAPDIVEAILDGRQPTELTAARLKRMRDLPVDWEQQRRYLGFDKAQQAA